MCTDTIMDSNKKAEQPPASQPTRNTFSMFQSSTVPFFQQERSKQASKQHPTTTNHKFFQEKALNQCDLTVDLGGLEAPKRYWGVVSRQKKMTFSNNMEGCRVVGWQDWARGWVGWFWQVQDVQDSCFGLCSEFCSRRCVTSPLF